MKKNEMLLTIKSMDGGRISLNQDTTGICEVGHISTNKFALIWVVRGDQEFLSVRVMVDGECSGTSHGFMMLITPRHERFTF
jgi:hypothetical protein